MARVGISLGSNLGDRLGLLRDAYRRLVALSEGDVFCSSIYETDPVDCAEGDPAFLNAVAEIEFALEPLDLLSRTQAFESEFGRPRERARNAPRPIDLDLLYFGDLEMKTERLVLPHPRIHERDFVRIPLAEIRPDLVSVPSELPGGIRIYPKRLTGS